MSALTRSWLAECFQVLEERGVRYVALRVDAESLDHDDELDLLVHPSSFGELLAVVRRLCRDRPELHCLVARRFGNASASILLVEEERLGELRSLRLDVRSGIHKDGDVVLDSTALDPTQVVYDGEMGMRRLEGSLEGALLRVRNAYDRRPASPKHLRIFKARGSGDIDGEIRRLGYDPEAIASGTPRRLRPERPVTRLRYAVRAALGRFTATGRGLNIVFYGPDGVGKSTQVAMLADRLVALGVRRGSVETYHAFVRTERLEEHARSRSSAVKRAGYRRARHRVVQVPMLIAAYLKRLVRYATRIRPRVRSGVFVLHDRYLFDVFLKFQKVYGRRLPGMESWLGRIRPRQDLVFVLVADPGVVVHRTGELSIEQVEMVYESLTDCFPVSSRVIWLDAAAAPDVIHETVMRQVLDHQNRSFLGRSGSEGHGYPRGEVDLPAVTG